MATVLFVGEVIADGPDIVYEASTEQRRRTAWSMRGVTRPSEGTKMELRLKPLARLIDTLPEGDLKRFVEAGLTGDFTCARHLLATGPATHTTPHWVLVSPSRCCGPAHRLPTQFSLWVPT